MRETLAGSELVLGPSTYDGLTLWLIEQAEFGAVYMTGFGTAASLLGPPDVGFLSFSEMVDNAHNGEPQF